MSDNVSKEIKPCPFCGGTNIHVREGSTFKWVQPECMDCGATSGEVRLKAEDHYVVWNTRFEQASTGEAVAIVTGLAGSGDGQSHITKTTSFKDGAVNFGDSLFTHPPTSDAMRDKQDAERYRWLCNQDGDASVQILGAISWVDPAMCCALTFQGGKAQIDEAIDLAMTSINEDRHPVYCDCASCEPSQYTQEQVDALNAQQDDERSLLEQSK
jgi:hypothetical protein